MNTDRHDSLKMSREGYEGGEGRLLLEPSFPSYPSRDSSKTHSIALRVCLEQLPLSVPIRGIRGQFLLD